MPDKNQGIMSLFEGTEFQNLSEGFRQKVQTIFESVISAKTVQIKEELEKQNEAVIQERATKAIQEMEIKIDDYLTYVAEEWMKENKLSVDKGIKNELAESFLSGLKTLFDDHYVQIPEDKVDVVAEMATTIDTLETERNTAINENIHLKKTNTELVKAKVIAKLSEGLADSEKDKLNVLVSEIVFVDEATFTEKICTIAETFLGKKLCEGCGDEPDGDEEDEKPDKKDKKTGGDDDDDDDDEVDESVKSIVESISRKSVY